MSVALARSSLGVFASAVAHERPKKPGGSAKITQVITNASCAEQTQPTYHALPVRRFHKPRSAA